MSIQTQNRPELKKLADLIHDIPVAMLATLDADGALNARPMALLEMDTEGVLWFFTDLHASKLDRLAQVQLSFCDPADSTWVSVSGHGEVDTDRGRIEAMWTPMARPWFPDGAQSPALALLRVVPHSADYWDGPNNRMVRALGVMASVIAGQPVGMGDQGSLPGLSPGLSPSA